MPYQDIIYLGIALVTALFAVYLYFRKPQEQSESNDRVFNIQLNNVEKTIQNLADNHVHTLEVKLDAHINDNHNFIEQDIKWKSRMETLLDERLPRK